MSTLSGPSTLGRMGSETHFIAHDIDVLPLSFGHEHPVCSSSYNGFQVRSSHADRIARYRDTKPQLLDTALLTLWKYLVMEQCQSHPVKGQSIR
jgi:hypothetical protein